MTPNTSLPALATPHLYLRVPTVRDAAAMARFAADNRDHFEPWDPMRGDDFFTESYWKGSLAADLERVRDGTHLQFVLFTHEQPDGAIVGQCTLSGITRGVFQAAYLGYGLDHRHLRKGLMTEALRATIDYCFGEMNLHRLMANTMPENERSMRLLDRLGFAREGLARDYLYLGGEWRDHVLMSLTNPEWSPPPSA